MSSAGGLFPYTIEAKEHCAELFYMSLVPPAFEDFACCRLLSEYNVNTHQEIKRVGLLFSTQCVVQIGTLSCRGRHGVLNFNCCHLVEYVVISYKEQTASNLLPELQTNHRESFFFHHVSFYRVFLKTNFGCMEHSLKSRILLP